MPKRDGTPTKAEEKENAFARRYELVKQFRATGQQPPPPPDLNNLPVVEGPALVEPGWKTMSNGGGDWFVVTDTAIWHLDGNNGDGHSWAASNVVHVHRACIGRKVAPVATLAAELRALDALIGGKDDPLRWSRR